MGSLCGVPVGSAEVMLYVDLPPHALLNTLSAPHSGPEGNPRSRVPATTEHRSCSYQGPEKGDTNKNDEKHCATNSCSSGNSAASRLPSVGGAMSTGDRPDPCCSRSSKGKQARLASQSFSARPRSPRASRLRPLVLEGTRRGSRQPGCARGQHGSESSSLLYTSWSGHHATAGSAF